MSRLVRGWLIWVVTEPLSRAKALGGPRMKANRKFLRSDDDAVSPVIAVILMVAITVVLAATVYVWVSGFGSQSGTPAKTISLTSNGALATNSKTYAVASATSGMKWSDISFTLNGAALSYNNALGNG